MRDNNRAKTPKKHSIIALVNIAALGTVMAIISTVNSELVHVSMVIGFVGASAIAITSFVQYQYVHVPRLMQKQGKKEQAANYQEFFDTYSHQEREFNERARAAEFEASGLKGAATLDDTIPKTSLSLFSREVEDKLDELVNNGTLEPEIYEEVLAYLKVLPPEQRVQFLESNLFADFHLDGEVDPDAD